MNARRSTPHSLFRFFVILAHVGRGVPAYLPTCPCQSISVAASLSAPLAPWLWPRGLFMFSCVGRLGPIHVEPGAGLMAGAVCMRHQVCACVQDQFRSSVRACAPALGHRSAKCAPQASQLAQAYVSFLMKIDGLYAARRAARAPGISGGSLGRDCRSRR